MLLDPAIALDPKANAQRADDQRNPPSWASVDDAIAARRELRPPHAYADSDADVRAHLAEQPTAPSASASRRPRRSWPGAR